MFFKSTECDCELYSYFLLHLTMLTPIYTVAKFRSEHYLAFFILMLKRAANKRSASRNLATVVIFQCFSKTVFLLLLLIFQNQFIQGADNSYIFLPEEAKMSKRSSDLLLFSAQISADDDVVKPFINRNDVGPNFI